MRHILQLTEGYKMNEHQELAVRALSRMSCADDYGRARRAFAGYTPTQMATEYGQSGQSCAQILAGYEAHEQKIDAAIKWVLAQ